MTVTSKTTSHKPRVNRKVDNCGLVVTRCHHRNAPTPAVSMNVGAQRWVTHRVEMGHPPGKEERRRGRGEIGGRVGHGPAVNEVPHMIERHENHDGSANGVDRLHAPCGSSGGQVAHALENPSRIGSLPTAPPSSTPRTSSTPDPPAAAPTPAGPR